jgi:hypothetical protein
MKRNHYKGWPVVVVLLALWVSCDESREVSGDESLGKPVAIKVHLLGVAAGGEESVVRSASTEKAEAVSLPLGDGLLLEMSMERDELPLRAKTLENGKRFRVIAVRSAGKRYVAHGDYTMVAGQAVPDGLFAVPTGGTYDFICYSYNNDDQFLPASYLTTATLPTLSVDNTKDLLWCNIASNKAVNSDADAELDVLLNQQLAKITVVVDCVYNGWTITGVANNKMTLSALAATGTINDLLTGVLTNGSSSGTAGNRPIEWPTLATQDYSPTQSSKALLVMPRGSSALTLTVSGGAIARQGHDPLPSGVATMTAKFTTALAKGFAYKLHVKLRVPMWAGSNIYWDDTTDPLKPKLTFDAYYVDGEDAPHRGYQGVMFKWGSLVGIGPVGNFSGSTPIFVPIVKNPLNTSTWKATTGSTIDVDIPGRSKYSTWTPIVANEAALATDIPYMDGSFDASPYGRGNTFVMDVAQNDPVEMWANLWGDICQYLGATGAAPNGYRLPKSSEWGLEGLTYWDSTDPEHTPVGGGWVQGTAATHFVTTLTAGYPNGRADFLTDEYSDTFDPAKHTNRAGKELGSIKNLTMGNIVLPNSGYRNGNSSGILSDVGRYAYYWSGSANKATHGYELHSRPSQVEPANIAPRNWAASVRCVKD